MKGFCCFQGLENARVLNTKDSAYFKFVATQKQTYFWKRILAYGNKTYIILLIFISMPMSVLQIMASAPDKYV